MTNVYDNSELISPPIDNSELISPPIECRQTADGVPMSEFIYLFGQDLNRDAQTIDDSDERHAKIFMADFLMEFASRVSQAEAANKYNAKLVDQICVVKNAITYDLELFEHLFRLSAVATFIVDDWFNIAENHNLRHSAKFAGSRWKYSRRGLKANIGIIYH